MLPLPFYITYHISEESQRKAFNLSLQYAMWGQYGGYVGSATHGVFASFHKASLPIAVKTATIGRLSCNLGLQARALSNIVINVGNDYRSPIAKQLGVRSDVLSLATVFHGFLLKLWHLRCFNKEFQSYARGPALHMTALLIAASITYRNKAEKCETDYLLDCLSQQRGLPVKTIKAQLPHLTNNEYQAKTISLAIASLASITGIIGGSVAAIQANHPALLSYIQKTLPVARFSALGKYSMWASAFSYASWAFHPLLIGDDSNSEELRFLPSCQHAWEALQKSAWPEAYTQLALLSVALVLMQVRHPAIAIIGKTGLVKLEALLGVIIASNSFGPFYTRSFDTGNRIKQLSELLSNTTEKQEVAAPSI